MTTGHLVEINLPFHVEADSETARLLLANDARMWAATVYAAADQIAVHGPKALPVLKGPALRADAGLAKRDYSWMGTLALWLSGVIAGVVVCAIVLNA